MNRRKFLSRMVAAVPVAGVAISALVSRKECTELVSGRELYARLSAHDGMDMKGPLTREQVSADIQRHIESMVTTDAPMVYFTPARDRGWWYDLCQRGVSERAQKSLDFYMRAT